MIHIINNPTHVTKTSVTANDNTFIFCGAVAERLRHRSRVQNVPSSIPRLNINVEVTS